jgi:hypothetical protein
MSKNKKKLFTDAHGKFIITCVCRKNLNLTSSLFISATNAKLEALIQLVQLARGQPVDKSIFGQ